ncbi:hypothetical protein KOX_12050 [Klebsiella michiganensis KCTC 1686]|uniref:Uncharacterized protein n=1 Tax=Klebsiella michiganensis (strain ATCC 8724 / DSM 4798 / JCM 20051 / NBRC 3318 / NRRL B-199 / KCTC 1686 / BUCSAV 143 / CCM 1901) TaxID=1006551 RepID=A0A0H3H401_KLEM8|nr:hypothetical protein KOX_12050 [Klebsiella michiganensis KCTC 1686]
MLEKLLLGEDERERTGINIKKREKYFNAIF